MATAPVVDGRLRPSQARPPCLARHPPVTLAGSRPIARAAQKVTGGRTFATLLRLWRTPKGQHAGLVRMQGQSEASHPFVEYRHHTTRIVLTFKPDAEIVTVPNQGRFPLEPWFHLGFTPQIECVMQIGSKDGALPHYWGTSPPSALRTGQATRRCTQLASDSMSQNALAT